MMAMLIRAGLPSHRAAMAAITSAQPTFTTPAEMRTWLGSNQIAAFTDQGDWPTPETAALWSRFRSEALSGGIQKWTVERFREVLDVPDASPKPVAGLYRVLPVSDDRRTWLSTPDFQPIALFRRNVLDPKPSLSFGRLTGATRVVEVQRLGRGSARWM
jgi:hypothetical protein